VPGGGRAAIAPCRGLPAGALSLFRAPGGASGTEGRLVRFVIPGEPGGGVDEVTELDAVCVGFVTIRGALDEFDPVADEV
jgi:hypothetical protein